MKPRFDYFVIFAEMRTGSNFLEENLNDFAGLNCHGELFNPHFLGGPNKTEKFGLSMQARDSDPQALIKLLKSRPDGLPGFRFFSDHDPRILASCLKDRRCAKVILTRNPVETYVSREIARQTQQWRLGDLKNVKSAKITFRAEEFAAHLDRHQSIQLELLAKLQRSGQTAFYLAYEDIQDPEVVNGLARFLGAEEARKRTVTKTKKQNPQPLHEKVVNFAEMEAALASSDYFALNRTPNFEPRRGAALPTYIAAVHTPIIYAPIASGPRENIIQWLADLDKVDIADLAGDFTQKTLRHWKRKTGEHRSFTVVRHPVARLHEAFVRHILLPGPEAFVAIRQTLQKSYGLPIPHEMPDAQYDTSAHRAAFVAFAEFVQGNLNGQTGIRVDPAWATQSELLRGIGQFMQPDFVFREADLKAELGYLAGRFGKKPPALHSESSDAPVSLAAIYDAQVEAVVRAAYQRDYMMFGFGRWRD